MFRWKVGPRTTHREGFPWALQTWMLVIGAHVSFLLLVVSLWLVLRATFFLTPACDDPQGLLNSKSVLRESLLGHFFCNLLEWFYSPKKVWDVSHQPGQMMLRWSTSLHMILWNKKHHSRNSLHEVIHMLTWSRGNQLTITLQACSKVRWKVGEQSWLEIAQKAANFLTSWRGYGRHLSESCWCPGTWRSHESWGSSCKKLKSGEGYKKGPRILDR